MSPEHRVLDLRGYLAELGPALFEPVKQLSVVQEITALQHALGRAGRYPVIHVAHPRRADGPQKQGLADFDTTQPPLLDRGRPGVDGTA